MMMDVNRKLVSIVDKSSKLIFPHNCLNAIKRKPETQFNSTNMVANQLETYWQIIKLAYYFSSLLVRGKRRKCPRKCQGTSKSHS